MKTDQIIGWMVVNSDYKNCGIFPSRTMARWMVKELSHTRSKFRVCKIQVVH